MNAWLPPAVTSTRLFGLTAMPFSRASLTSIASTSAGSPSTGPYRWSVNVPPNLRAASMASRGGSYETTPCPSEIVPGVSVVQRPTMGITGA